jgi:hypothetical protein
MAEQLLTDLIDFDRPPTPEYSSGSLLGWSLKVSYPFLFPTSQYITGDQTIGLEDDLELFRGPVTFHEPILPNVANVIDQLI